jgi:hypothetical protein
MSKSIQERLKRLENLYKCICNTPSGGGGSQTLAETLLNGQVTGGRDVIISSGDSVFLNNGSKLKEGTTDAGLGGNKGIALICSIDYEYKWEAGILYVMEQDGFTIRETRHNFNTPTVNDDDTKGFIVGSRWIIATQKMYQCTDATTGSAVWVEDFYPSESNLGYTPSSTNGVITNDKGSDATLPLADATNAGLLTPADFTQLLNLGSQLLTLSTQLNTKSGDILLQDICINMPTNALTTVNNVVGTILTISGTPGIRTIADTNLFTRTTRLALETTIVVANVFTFRQIVGYFSMNTGFKASFKFGGSTGATNSNVRYSIGVFAANFIVTNVDPTTFITCAAFARIDGSANWHFIHNDNIGLATAIDLGGSFPANTVSTDMYYGVIETVGANIKYTLTRLNLGNTITGTVSTNLIAASTLLGISAGCSNNTNAAICALDFGGMQVTKFI